MNEKLKSVLVASYDCYSEDDWHYEDFKEGLISIC